MQQQQQQSPNQHVSGFQQHQQQQQQPLQQCCDSVDLTPSPTLAQRQDSTYLDVEEGCSTGTCSSGEDDEGSQDETCSTTSVGQDLPLPSPVWTPDYTFKVLLVGDSGVGKTCLVMRFISDKFEAQLPSTVGVDFAIKRMAVENKKIKLTIWDTAGQERFRALTSTFYRGAVGIIFVYDVTRRETLTSLSGSWMDELQSYDPHPEVARMVVANKVDQVSWQEGADFAKQHGCLFVETSAKHNIAVGVAFEELVLRILDTPALLAAVQAEEHKSSGLDLAAAQQVPSSMAISCSC